jgi:hypothetical protein
MKTQMFFRGIKIDLYLERYERINESRVFEKKLDIVNFELLPSKISIELPFEEYLKENADYVLGGKRKQVKLHTGLQKTSYPFLYQGNDEGKSEIRTYFFNQNRTLLIGYFRGFRIYPKERGLFNDAFMQMISNHTGRR